MVPESRTGEEGDESTRAAQPGASAVPSGCVDCPLVFCLLSPPSIAKETDYHAWLSAGARAKLVGGLYIDGTVVQRVNSTSPMFTGPSQGEAQVQAPGPSESRSEVQYAYILDGNQKVRLFPTSGWPSPLLDPGGLSTPVSADLMWIRNDGHPDSEQGGVLGIIDLLKPGVLQHFFSLDEAFET